MWAFGILIIQCVYCTMCLILKVNCAGVGFRSETRAEFQHENMGMRLVHSWMCGVLCCAISLYPLQAYMQLSEFDKSRTYLIKAGQLFPGNTEIRQELEKLDRFVSALA